MQKSKQGIQTKRVNLYNLGMRNMMTMADIQDREEEQSKSGIEQITIATIGGHLVTTLI